MADLPVKFAEARTQIEPTETDKDNAQAAHLQVRACLEADATLRAYGIDTVLIGSYKRQVTIRRVKDVDAPRFC
jgi:tRNA nucleotidyltransferase (CCA-adding enzyme)